MTSIESIEGMDKADVQALRVLAAELHEGTAGILDTPLSAKDYEEQEVLRDVMILKLREASAYLGSQISDLEVVKKDLSILMGWLRSDRDRIESLKISGYVREKAERNRYQS